MEWPKTWRPALYHGFGKRRNFFEGWYYKLADASQEHVYALIPGVFLGGDRESSYSFVQTIEGNTGHTTFQRYPLEAFRAAHRDFHVEVGPNCFREDRLSLNIEEPGLSLRGEVRLSGLTPWPVTLAAPGIMGPFAYAPYMECYHGVVSLNHSLTGRLQVDGRPIDFAGGVGYTEKDWGRSFPRAWIWMQTNHFERPGTCLTASVARIPWLGSAFRGFIAGLWHAGRLYRFATYTRARTLSLAVDDRQVTWQMLGRALGRRDPADYRLDVVATRSQGGLLHGPFRTDMMQRVAESLTAAITVHLWRCRAGREELVFQGTGRHAGLEINGRLADILR